MMTGYPTISTVPYASPAVPPKPHPSRLSFSRPPAVSPHLRAVFRRGVSPDGPGFKLWGKPPTCLMRFSGTQVRVESLAMWAPQMCANASVDVKSIAGVVPRSVANSEML